MKGMIFFSFQRREFLPELLGVTLVERCRTGREVGERPPGEYRPGPRPRSYGEARPFEQFAEIVGRRDVSEHPPAGNVVARVARLAQVADDMVGMEVYGHPRHEQGSPDVNVGLCEPVGVIAFGRDVEDPPALHQRVEGVERHAHHDDPQRHLRLSAQQQREDEGALQVVRLEQHEERQRPGLPCPPGHEPEHAHCDEHGRLHHDPAHLVGYRGPYFGLNR